MFEAIRERSEEAWEPISSAAFFSASALAAIIVYLANTGQRWVWILDGANLLFHEAGHPLFGMLSERLTVYGGTLGQLVFPIVVSVHFWWQRKAASLFLGVIWLMQNFWNIARYMADARAQELPLVGNGDRLHDWHEILSAWALLDQDTRLAKKLSTLAFVGTFLAWAYFYTAWRRSPREEA